jgi:cold-inducible RNA-binding protein
MPAKLFVGGIPYRMTDAELEEHFSAAGDVTSVFIPLDRETRRPRGFAFVEMSDEAAAEKAIEMFNETDMGGRQIVVNLARPAEDRS